MPMPRVFRRALLATAGLALLALPAGAQTVPAGFVVDDAFPNQSFTLPVAMVFLPDGRKLVVEKEGRIWTVTAGGVKLPTPFIDLSAKVLSNDDRGLHGVALDPDFATNRWVYMLYTADPDSNGVDDNIPAFGRLERYQVNAANPNVVDLSTRQILIGGGFADGIPEPPRNMHHMVGTIRFGADKTLMVGSGDGANADITDAGGTDPSFGPGLIDPAQNIGAFRAQSLNSMNGKLLRVDKETGLGLPSNPFWNGVASSARSRVWLYGLRNPFRFAFRPGTGNADPALGQPGVLYVGDVGWNQTEECDIARTGGLNLGWPCIEGNHGNALYQAVGLTSWPNNNVLCSAPLNSENPVAKTLPAFWWDHANGTLSSPAGWVGNCAIGGVFCSGISYPAAWQGLYFLGDYGTGWIRALRMDANDNLVSVSDFVTSGGGVVDIETDPATGDLYYVDINASAIRHVRYAPGEPAPIVNATLSPTAGFAPLTVTATASGSTDPDGDPLTFLWTFGDGSTSHHADTTYTYTVQGSYLATVAVNDGHGGIGTKSFPVVVGQVPPPGKITQPITNSFFYQNQPLTLQASPVDTSVTSAEYRWDVDLGHNNHLHPGQSVFYGQTATLVPLTPNDGERYFLRIRLKVTQGLLATLDTVFIYPRVNLAAADLEFDPPFPGPSAQFTVSTKVFSTGEVGSPPVPFQVLDGSTVLATGTVGPILQGDSLVVGATVGPLAFGDHALRLWVDPTDSLTELDKTDNTGSGTVTVSGLIAAYGMDQGSGTTIADKSGHAITGTLVGATWATPGKYGSALRFNGTSAYVDLGNPPLLGATGSMTWSAWVRPEMTPPDDGIILGRSDDNGGWQLKSTPDTGPRTFGIAISGGSLAHTQRYGTLVPLLNTWYHVAGVFDAQARTLDLYVNGALDDGVLLGTVPSAQVDPGLSATIGRRVGGYCFGGVIDEVRIYNRALSQAEIQADMNTPLASAPLDVPGRDTPALPAAYSLRMSGPNPFHTRATLAYTLPRAGHVRLQVFDVSGQLVSTIENGLRAAGTYTVTFEPKRLASGLYFCRLEAGGFVASRKLFLLR
jgi:glucose/arabinose dehydrogenase